MSELHGDAPMIEMPASGRATATAAVIGLAFGITNTALLVRMRRPKPIDRDGRLLIGAAVLLGAGIGASLRVLGARAVGANIGGGIVMLFGPIAGIGLLSYARHRWQAIWRV